MTGERFRYLCAVHGVKPEDTRFTVQSNGFLPCYNMSEFDMEVYLSGVRAAIKRKQMQEDDEDE